MTVKNNVAFSTEFLDHQGLIHKLTKKCWGRLKDVGIDDHEYEDIFQINCMTYVKAAKAFDTERGITFGAYLGRAIYNQFNQYAKALISEKLELGLISYEDFKTDDDDGFDFIAVYMADPTVINSIEQSAILKELAREQIAKLSKLGRLVIRELISPSSDLQKSFIGMRAHAEMAKSQGEKYLRIPKAIDMRAIKIHYGLRHRDMVDLKTEFKLHLGVTVE